MHTALLLESLYQNFTVDCCSLMTRPSSADSKVPHGMSSHSLFPCWCAEEVSAYSDAHTKHDPPGQVSGNC